ncbi:MAG: phosphodiester glycosidase family protein, partial [Firmicutes bacterium]|nr:phosphodiester glycosidase family protein [Bacillota bacterium]
MKRLLLLVLSLILVIGLIPAAASAAHPEIVTQLAEGLYLHDNGFYSKYAEGDIYENFFVYTPNTKTTPYVCYGRDVAGAASLKKVFTMEAEDGNSIVAAANGDYFNLTYGTPIGIEIKDGIIHSSEHSSFEALGFTADGHAIIGDPGLNITFKDDSAGISWEDINYNKPLSDASGAVLINDDFNEHNYASKESLNIIITKTGGSAAAGDTITGVVKEVLEADGRVSIADGEMDLCILKSSYLEVQNQMANIKAGDAVSVSFAISDEWKNITQAVGVKEILLDEGATITFPDETRAPRTCVGIKKDGTVVLYTCDGRQAGGSYGLTLTECSRRMYQLGCYYAANLDGGASTQCFAVYPGDTEMTQVNVDSGTYLRSCANYICFKNNLPASGVPKELFVSPESLMLAAETKESINVKLVDTNWHAIQLLPDEISYEVSGIDATVSGSAVTAGAKEGEGTIKVSYGKLSKEIALSIVNDWPLIEAKYEDGQFSAEITDPANVGIEKSGISLSEDGKTLAFTYEGGKVSADLSEADDMLHHIILTVRNKNGHVARAAISAVYEKPEEPVETIEPVESTEPAEGTEAAEGMETTEPQENTEPEENKPVFADMGEDRWSTKYVEYLYRQGIISGSAKGDSLVYKPEDYMTRQEFAKLIVAWTGKNPDDYAETELVFNDNDRIDAWALPYVKAAYSLGIMNGKSSGEIMNFDPQGRLTRQEAMTVIGRLTEKGFEKSDLLDFP